MIHVVMVTYNSAHVICPSLVPLVADPQIAITVVDNQSVDHTVETIRSTFPSVAVLESGANLGFAKAVNLGVSRRDDEFVLLLNPDAVVSAPAIRAMAERMRNDPGIGIAAPHIAQPAGTLEVLELGRYPSLRRVFLHYSGLSRLAGVIPAFEGQFLLKRHTPTSRDVDWVTGAVLMIRGDLLLKLGGLTERWFMYSEDIELCYRTTSLGLRVRYFHDLEAEHLVGASVGGEPKQTDAAPFVNLLDFYRLEMSPSPLHTLFWRGVLTIGLFSRALAYQVRVVSASSVEKDYWRRRSGTFRDYARAVMTARFH